MFSLKVYEPVQSNCSNGEIRLADGFAPHEGRVEICISETWGTICDSSWNDADGNVVCKQLGYLPLGVFHINFCEFMSITNILYLAFSGAKAKSGPFGGTGVGPILLSNLYCNGQESSLLDCRANVYGVLSCSHSSDAGVSCEGS